MEEDKRRLRVYVPTTKAVRKVRVTDCHSSKKYFITPVSSFTDGLAHQKMRGENFQSSSDQVVNIIVLIRPGFVTTRMFLISNDLSCHQGSLLLLKRGLE